MVAFEGKQRSGASVSIAISLVFVAMCLPDRVAKRYMGGRQAFVGFVSPDKYTFWVARTKSADRWGSNVGSRSLPRPFPEGTKAGFGLLIPAGPSYLMVLILRFFSLPARQTGEHQGETPREKSKSREGVTWDGRG